MITPFRDMTISKYKLLVNSVILIITLAASDRIILPDQPKDKIDWYNKYFPMEKVFLHTDKFIYEAGETIWFKGYISSLTGERTPLYSNDLYIKLLDQQTEELMYRRYPIVNNVVTGYLALPKSTIEGKYYLLAYTSWMKNSDPGQIFNKEIVVVKNNRRKIIADFRLLEGESCISDTFVAILNVRNQTGEPVAGASISYFIQGINKSLRQGNSITDPRGIAQIKDFIPVYKVEDACFIKFIISSKQGNGKYIFPLPVSSGDIRVQFNTSHGYMLKNHETRVGFKTANKDGVSVYCEGEIINQSGKAIMTFKSGVNGIGSFSFVPHDPVYKARIIVPPDDSLFILPPVRESGIYFDYQGIKNHSLYYTVKIAPSDSIIKTSWVVSTSHKKYWSSEIEVTHNTPVEIPLPEEIEGLIQVSIFDENADLLYDNLMMGKNVTRSLKVVADKSRYGKREQVITEIIHSGPEDINGNLDLSISVSQKHLAENRFCKNIDEYMVYENRFPTVIFRSGSVDTNTYLMLGKPFPVNWEIIGTHLEAGQERYYNRDGLTGIVYDKRKTPVGYAKVKAINIANWKSYETQCDESGIFRVLFGSDIIDFNYLNINAFDASGKVTLWPSVDQDFSKTVSSSFLITEQDAVRQRIADLYKYPYPDVVASFQYQEKKKKNPDRETKKIPSPQQYVNYSTVMDIIMDLRSLDIVNNQIFFKGIPYAYTNQTGALILVDGIPQGTHISIINNLNPPDIVYINILTTPTEIRRYTSTSYPAVLEIITVRGVAQNRMLPGLSGIDMLEVNREFHSPDYTLAKPPKDDIRTTLYWNPSIVMPASSNRKIITFYTSDISGNYVIKVQGFDNTGKPVSAQTEFTVKE